MTQNEMIEMKKEVSLVWDELRDIAIKHDRVGNPTIWNGAEVFNLLLSEKKGMIPEEEYNRMIKKMENTIIEQAPYFYHYRDLIVVPGENIFYCNRHGLKTVFTIIPTFSKKIAQSKMWVINHEEYDLSSIICKCGDEINTFDEWMAINNIDDENRQYIYKLITYQGVEFEDAIKMRLGGNTCPIVQYDYNEQNEEEVENETENE